MELSSLQVDNSDGVLREDMVLARSRASDLQSVKKLNSWGDSLKDISILRSMQNVEVVSLSVNKIETLRDLKCCQQLQELYIRKNNITDLREICHLQNLPRLKTLWLADNPCATRDSYRMTVLRNLPTLSKLDNTDVQLEEVERALVEGEELRLPDTATSCSEEQQLQNEFKEEVEVAGTDVAATSEALHETNGEESPTEAAAETEPPQQASENNQSDIAPEMKSAPEAAVDGQTLTDGAGDCRPQTAPPSRSLSRDKVQSLLTLEETNKIRIELGLQPLSADKVINERRRPHTCSNHTLQAVLLLIRDLDRDCLQIVNDAISRRLQRTLSSPQTDSS